MALRVLVTGGTGFVGKHLVRSLVANGVEVHLVTRATQKDGVAPSSVSRIVPTQDLFSESPSWWEGVCQDIDAVVHLAWYVEPGKYLGSHLNLDCLIGSFNLMKGAVSAGVPRIIGIGTCLEYDLSSGHVSVQTPLKPETPYAAAKAASYLALSQWLPSKGVSFAWCRLFYLYGEGEDQRRLVPYIRSQLEAGRVAQLGSGTQIRDYMNVLEAASTLANIVLGREEGPLNISTGVPTTVRQLATVIAEGYGRTDLLNFDSKLDDPLDPKCVVGIPHDLKP